MRIIFKFADSNSPAECRHYKINRTVGGGKWRTIEFVQQDEVGEVNGTIVMRRKAKKKISELDRNVVSKNLYKHIK